jgi:endonuclease YncB( thermonuclease family)
MSSPARRALVLVVAIVVLAALNWWPRTTPDASPPTSLPTPLPTSLPASPGVYEEWSVVSVIDGDTLIAERNGTEETVRFIGIDTPERDTCGYGEAREALKDWVDHTTMRLVSGAETDRDDYGRLLRYVEVNGTDVGLWLIQNGYAAARYDYRSHQPHDREDDYIAADADSADLCPGWG